MQRLLFLDVQTCQCQSNVYPPGLLWDWRHVILPQASEYQRIDSQKVPILVLISYETLNFVLMGTSPHLLKCQQILLWSLMRKPRHTKASLIPFIYLNTKFATSVRVLKSPTGVCCAKTPQSLVRSSLLSHDPLCTSNVGCWKNCMSSQ